MWTTAKQSTCAFSKPFTRGWLAAGWTVLATGRTGRTSASRVKDRDLGVTNWWMAGMRLCHLNTYKYKFWPSLLISHVFFFCFFSALQVQTQPRTYVALVSWGWCTLCTLSWTQRLCHWLETSTSYHNTLHRYHQIKKKNAHASCCFGLFFFFFFFQLKLWTSRSGISFQ